MPPTRPGARHRASRGFTLIELMMAMVVSGIVLLGIFAFSSIQQGNAVIHRRHVRIQQALEGSMYSIARDVRTAGLGFARMCTEVRIWDPSQNKLINPGAVDDVSQVVLDPMTQEPYWVLRDGLQGHWRSAGALSIDGNAKTSASTSSAADSFDVMMGEPGFTDALGVFRLAVEPPTVAGANVVLDATGNLNLLDSGNASHVSAVRQLMPPGSFVLVARSPDAADPFRPMNRGQCVLLQVSDDVQGGGGADWTIPIGNQSGFNQGLDELFAGGPANCPDLACSDWNLAADAAAGALVIPIGHLRWSRYEIDYSVPAKPYLVRADLIGYLDGTDPTAAGDELYPSCDANSCPLAQLHLPNNQNDPIPKVAIGPMIEDMQVAVGCDGYTVASAQNDVPQVPEPFPLPDVNYAEKGDEANNQPNKFVDEWTNDKSRDEWLGNAAAEQWAPDCVYFGVGQEFAAEWLVSGPASEQMGGPGFMMSPSTFRVTLLGKSETTAGGNADDPGNQFFNELFPIEDRPQLTSIVPEREYLTVTERFSPRNLRWRDPLLQ